MARSTDDRRREVLRAVVADYIASQEPVGSKTLLERCLLYTSPSPRDKRQSRMPSSA